MINEDNSLFKSWLSDSVAELKAGKQVLAYFKYQLDELIRLYKDNLIYKYNESCDWWECCLKEKSESRYLIRKRRGKVDIKRKDITKEKVMELKNQGLSDIETARRLNCSMCVVRHRLGKSI